VTWRWISSSLLRGYPAGALGGDEDEGALERPARSKSCGASVVSTSRILLSGEQAKVDRPLVELDVGGPPSLPRSYARGFDGRFGAFVGYGEGFAGGAMGGTLLFVGVAPLVPVAGYAV
jgi:hypothetical protein